MVGDYCACDKGGIGGVQLGPRSPFCPCSSVKGLHFFSMGVIEQKSFHP